MTDYEKYTQLLTEFGVEFDVLEDAEGKEVGLHAKSEKVEGYFGFYSEALFDQDGAFINFGVWE